jgi:hypothetical protein
MTTIHRAIYSKLGASANTAYNPQFYTMCTVVPDIYNVLTAPYIQDSTFNWTYLRCHWRYVDNSMCVILQAWCQIQRTCSSLRYLNCGPGHIQCTYSSKYSGFNIQQNISALLWEIYRQFNVRYTANIVPNTTHIPQFTPCELLSRPYTNYLQLLIYMLQYSMERICAAIGDYRTFRSPLYCKLGAKYSAHLPVTLCGLWSRTYTKYLQLLIVRLQYSTEPDCAATTDMPTFGCALYCNIGAIYSALPPVYFTWTVARTYSM